MKLVPVLLALSILCACVPTPARTLNEYYESIDTSCTAASDCVIKDVGNCCGYFPKCVNKDAQIDKNALGSLCKGQVGVCGFVEIQECTCNSGTCEAVNGAVVG